MLRGRITPEREAIVELEIHGDDHRVRIEAIIDTGYDGFLTLPRSIIDELSLPFLGPARTTLGDGNEARLDVYLARVLWQDDLTDVLVLDSDSVPLVGMAMLRGSRLTMDVEEEGAVSIQPLAEIRSSN